MTRSAALVGLVFVGSYGLPKTQTPRWLTNTTLALLIGGIWFSSTNVSSLGDQDQWVRQARTPEVWLSEPYANVIHKVVVHLFNRPELLGLLAPVAGIATAFLFMCLAKPLGLADKQDDFVLPMFFAGTAAMFLYSIGFVENTILSSPFLVLFLYFSLKYVQSSRVTKAFSGTLLAATVALAIAILIHGQNLFFAPAIAVLPFLAQNKRRLRDTFATALVAILILGMTIGLGLLALLPWGLELSLGNATGGAAGGAFVPLTEAGFGQFDRFTMFSMQHFAEFGTIVFLSAPLALLLPVLVIFARITSWGKEHIITIARKSTVALLALVSLAYIGFVFLWNFDLAAPRDLDLMLSMGIVLSAFTAYTLYLVLEKWRWLLVYLFAAQALIQLVIFADLKTGYSLLS